MMLPAVIVTGASGFVGRNLIAELAADHRVFAIARRSQRECGAPLHANIAWMQMDIAYPEGLARVFREIAAAGGARFLIHLAAYYDFTGEAHPEYERTNITGLRNVLELARPLRLARFVFASSVAACAFPRATGPVREDTPPDGEHVYAWSKREGERIVRECTDIPSCIVRMGAVFSDWCEYPPLYMLLSTWLGRSWRARILAGQGGSAIPYIHARDVVGFYRRLLACAERLGAAEPLVASTSGATSHEELYALSRQHDLGRARRPVHVPRAICSAGLRLMTLAGRVSGAMPFERPWMRMYIDRRLEVDNARTCELLDWAPAPRYHITRRFPYILERLRSEPLAWHARNEAIMRRVADRPDLQIYRGLLAIEEQVIERVTALVRTSPDGAGLTQLRALEPGELAWLLRLIYRLVLTSVQTGDRMLVLSYMELTAQSRFRAGFTAAELGALLDHLNREILALLAARRETAGLTGLLRERITVPFEFAKDEIQEQHDRYRQGAAATAAPGRAPAAELSPRELLEQTVWQCLVQRK